MSEGVLWMLWLDRTGQKGPADVIGEAVSYYRRKFGQSPNRALVPEAFPETVMEGLSIERRRTVSPGHVMVAFDPDPEPQTASAEE